MLTKRGVMKKKSEGFKTGFVPSGWTVKVKHFFDENYVVKITSDKKREGTNSFTVIWDSAKEKFVSLSRGTGMAAKNLKDNYTDLHKEVCDLLVSGFIEDVPLASMSDVKDYSPKGEGWVKVEAFNDDGWALWAKESIKGWITLKLISLIERRKMVYWLGWSMTEKRFANNQQTYSLSGTEIFDKLTKFLMED